MKFTTLSGSIYELDQENKRLRRLYGKRPSTDRQGDDWKCYVEIFPNPIVIGSRVLIYWIQEETPLLEGSPENSIATTLTSPVQSIEENHGNPN